jgi:hypothetical protein
MAHKTLIFVYCATLFLMTFLEIDSSPLARMEREGFQQNQAGGHRSPRAAADDVVDPDTGKIPPKVPPGDGNDTEARDTSDILNSDHLLDYDMGTMPVLLERLIPYF